MTKPKKKTEKGRPFSIAFISPSPVTLKHDWYRNLLWQSVGVPNLAGGLKRAGFPLISQYDFNNQPLRVYSREPGKVKLMLYAEEKPVSDFLRGKKTAAARRIAEQTDFLIECLEIKKHGLFAITLNNFLGDNREIDLGARLAKCLAAALKKRFPGTAVMLGGMQNMDIKFMREGYEKILRGSRAIDYAVCGEGHKAILEICRAVREKRPFHAERPLIVKKIGRASLIQADDSEDAALPHARYFAPLEDDDVKDPSVPFGLPAYDRTNSKNYCYTGRRVREFYHLPETLAAGEKLFAPDNYLTLQVSFSEGCNFNCLFCSNARTGVFELDMEACIGMLKRFRDEYGCRHFLFYNPQFNPSYGRARKFLERIIKEKLDILWADCFNLRNMDKELITLMREAGVMKVVCGVEYPTPRMLEYINKGITVDKINRNLEELNRQGIWNHALLITGMPTETSKDVRELESWLKDTKDLVNAYTVGSFHMALGSPFQRDPEKFGFELKAAMRLYCQTEFDEKGGLEWHQKALQNELNNKSIRQFIDELKGSPKATGSRMEDSHLLMYLYRVLGHERKAEIARLYEDAYTLNPHIAPAYAHLRKQLAHDNSGLNRQLRSSRTSLDLGGCGRETFNLTLNKSGAEIPCSVAARNEETLINPAPDRVHGEQFLLKTQPRRSGQSIKADIESILKELRAKLSEEKARDTGFVLRLSAPSGTALFTILPSIAERHPSAARKQGFSFRVCSGSPDRNVLNTLGALLLLSANASVLPGGAVPSVMDKKLLAKILEITENWCTRPPVRRKAA